MNKYRVVIHVGLPKTGSTFLQKEIFPKLKNCETFGQFNRHYWINMKMNEKKINIITDEQFSGRPNTSMEAATRYEIAKRLRGAFPNAKIIVIFREKDDWIKSLYAEYIKSGRGAYNFDKWYDQIFDKSSLDFNKYEKCLKDLFDEVLVCHFEDLKNRPEYFVKKICNFIGADIPKYTNKIVNIRLDKTTMERWRKMNRLFCSRYSPHKGILPERLNPLMHYLKFCLNEHRLSGFLVGKKEKKHEKEN